MQRKANRHSVCMLHISYFLMPFVVQQVPKLASARQCIGMQVGRVARLLSKEP